MKLLVAFLFLAVTAVSVQSSPLDRIPSDVSIQDIKDSDIDIEKLLEVLEKIEQKIPDNWRVIAKKVAQASCMLMSAKNVFQMTNVISVPTYCEDGYKVKFAEALKSRI